MATSLSRTLPLTHKWTALYHDGSTFVQPDDDAPKQPRPDGTGSAYGDIDHTQLAVFFLEGNGHLYSVDLRSGVFCIDEVPFLAGDDDVELGPRRLVFFRRVAHDQHTDVQDGQRVGESRLGESRRCYYLGWTAHVKNAQGRLTAETRYRTIAVGHEVFGS